MRVRDFGFHRMLGLVVGLGILAVGSTATAASTAFDLSAGAGGGQLRVTLDDGVMPGAVKITAEIIGGEGNIQALFLNLAEDVPGLMFSGPDFVFAASGVSSLGAGLDFFGGDTCPCDWGIQVGGPFAALNMTMLYASSIFPGIDVTIASFLEIGAVNDGEQVTGSPGDGMMVPEPGTASLIGMGLLGLAVRRRR